MGHVGRRGSHGGQIVSIPSHESRSSFFGAAGVAGSVVAPQQDAAPWWQPLLPAPPPK
jgi:hypothetical protein